MRLALIDSGNVLPFKLSWGDGRESELIVFKADDVSRINRACDILRDFGARIRPETTLKEIIDVAAAESGCSREQLCAFLLTVGIGHLERP